MKKRMHYLAACSISEAERVAARQGWQWPDYRYVFSVEQLRCLAPTTNLYVYDGDQVQDVIGRLTGKSGHTWGSRLAPLLAEANRRGLNVIRLD